MVIKRTLYKQAIVLLRPSFALLVASQIASRSKVVVARKVFTGRFTCYAQAAIVGKKRERKGFALILW